MSGTKILNGESMKASMSFNLVEEPWIPVTDLSGKAKMVSLQELYAKARDWSDLATDPLETIVVLRLLICITQRALNGPNNRDEWNAVGQQYIQASLDYLDKWKDQFDLFGDKPFLQVKSLKKVKKVKKTKKATKIKRQTQLKQKRRMPP